MGLYLNQKTFTIDKSSTSFLRLLAYSFASLLVFFSQSFNAELSSAADEIPSQFPQTTFYDYKDSSGRSFRYEQGSGSDSQKQKKQNENPEVRTEYKHEDFLNSSHLDSKFTDVRVESDSKETHRLSFQVTTVDQEGNERIVRHVAPPYIDETKDPKYDKVNRRLISELKQLCTRSALGQVTHTFVPETIRFGIAQSIMAMHIWSEEPDPANRKHMIENYFLTPTGQFSFFALMMTNEHLGRGLIRAGYPIDICKDNITGYLPNYQGMRSRPGSKGEMPYSGKTTFKERMLKNQFVRDFFLPQIFFAVALTSSHLVTKIISGPYDRYDALKKCTLGYMNKNLNEEQQAQRCDEFEDRFSAESLWDSSMEFGKDFIGFLPELATTVGSGAVLAVVQGGIASAMKDVSFKNALQNYAQKFGYNIPDLGATWKGLRVRFTSGRFTRVKPVTEMVFEVAPKVGKFAIENTKKIASLTLFLLAVEYFGDPLLEKWTRRDSAIELIEAQKKLDAGLRCGEKKNWLDSAAATSHLGPVYSFKRWFVPSCSDSDPSMLLMEHSLREYAEKQKSWRYMILKEARQKYDNWYNYLTKFYASYRAAYNFYRPFVHSIIQQKKQQQINGKNNGSSDSAAVQSPLLFQKKLLNSIPYYTQGWTGHVPGTDMSEDHLLEVNAQLSEALDYIRQLLEKDQRVMGISQKLNANDIENLRKIFDSLELAQRLIHTVSKQNRQLFKTPSNKDTGENTLYMWNRNGSKLYALIGRKQSLEAALAAQKNTSYKISDVEGAIQDVGDGIQLLNDILKNDRRWRDDGRGQNAGSIFDNIAGTNLFVNLRETLKPQPKIQYVVQGESNPFVKLRLILNNPQPMPEGLTAVVDPSVLWSPKLVDMLKSEKESYFPTQLGHTLTPTVHDYLLASMLCGPLANPVEKQNLVQIRQGFDVTFYPPSILSHKLSAFDLDLCNRRPADPGIMFSPASPDSHGVHQGEWVLAEDGQNRYKGFLDIIKNNILEDFISSPAPSAAQSQDQNGVVNELAAFDAWWARNVGTEMDRGFKVFDAKYREIINKDFLPAFSHNESYPVVTNIKGTALPFATAHLPLGVRESLRLQSQELLSKLSQVSQQDPFVEQLISIFKAEQDLQILLLQSPDNVGKLLPNISFPTRNLGNAIDPEDIKNLQNWKSLSKFKRQNTVLKIREANNANLDLHMQSLQAFVDASYRYLDRAPRLTLNIKKINMWGETITAENLQGLTASQASKKGSSAKQKSINLNELLDAWVQLEGQGQSAAGIAQSKRITLGFYYVGKYLDQVPELSEQGDLIGVENKFKTEVLSPLLARLEIMLAILNQVKGLREEIAGYMDMIWLVDDNEELEAPV